MRNKQVFVEEEEKKEKKKDFDGVAALPPTMKAAVYSEYGEAQGKVFKANAVPQNVVCNYR